MLGLVLQLLGFFTACALLRAVAPFLLSKIFGPKKLSKGSWAVITGATDGIGKAYCTALAKRGLNILLISRTLSRLQDTAKEIEDKFGVETKVVAADFADVSTPGFMSPIRQACQDLEVSVLVNNVGQSYDMPMMFAEDDTTEALLQQLVRLNTLSTMLMTKLVIPGMNSRKNGVVINISSAAGAMPCGSPMLAGYSASKAAVAALSKSIQYEVGSRGVTCQVHTPYFVVSKMSKIKRPSMMIPTPDQWVAASLAMVGYGGTTIVPYFAHFLQDFVVGLLPEFVSGWYTLRLHKDIRRRAIKKAEREAAAKKD